MEPKNNEEQIKDTTQVVLPLKIAIPVMLFLMSSAIGAFSGYMNIINTIKEGDRAIRDAIRFDWTLLDAQEWAREVHRLNPNVIVPDPNDIFFRNHKAALPNASASVITNKGTLAAGVP